MHTFQPYPMELLEMNPFTKFEQDWALVTAGDKDNVNTMTISWGGVGHLWNKNVVFIFVRDSRYTKEFLDKECFFSLSFLDEKYRDALRYCGSHSGREGNKFEKSGLTCAHKHGIPFADESNLVFLCEKLFATKLESNAFIKKSLLNTWYADGDMHTLYVGEIIEAMAK